jgi:hypothetical protein
MGFQDLLGDLVVVTLKFFGRNVRTNIPWTNEQLLIPAEGFCSIVLFLLLWALCPSAGRCDHWKIKFPEKDFSHCHFCHNKSQTEGPVADSEPGLQR